MITVGAGAGVDVEVEVVDEALALAGSVFVTVVTFCCGVDCSAPVCCASRRKRWTESITSFGWARNASPRLCTCGGFSPSATSAAGRRPAISRWDPRAARRRPESPRPPACAGCHVTTAPPVSRSSDRSRPLRSATAGHPDRARQALPTGRSARRYRPPERVASGPVPGLARFGLLAVPTRGLRDGPRRAAIDVDNARSG